MQRWRFWIARALNLVAPLSAASLLRFLLRYRNEYVSISRATIPSGQGGHMVRAACASTIPALFPSFANSHFGTPPFLFDTFEKHEFAYLPQNKRENIFYSILFSPFHPFYSLLLNYRSPEPGVSRKGGAATTTAKSKATATSASPLRGSAAHQKADPALRPAPARLRWAGKSTGLCAG